MAVNVDEAYRRVEEAATEGRTSLDLSDLRLTELPPRLADLHGLTELQLDDNWLTELPEWLGALPLTWLQLDRNRFAGLPAWLGRLTGLTSLGLGGCALGTGRNCPLRTKSTPARPNAR